MLKLFKNLDIETLNIGKSIFDFDGTIRSGLLLAEATSSVIEGEKRLQFKQLMADSKTIPFEETMFRFTKIIDGIECKILDSSCKDHLTSIYPGFNQTLNILRKYGIKVYLSSLTSQYVSELVISDLCLDGGTYFSYPIKKFNDKYYYASLNSDFKKVNLAEYKLDSLMLRGIIKKDEPFLFFGDSTQDLSLINNATYSVGINPDSKLNEKLFDLVVYNQSDPWEEINKLLLNC